MLLSSLGLVLSGLPLLLLRFFDRLPLGLGRIVVVHGAAGLLTFGGVLLLEPCSILGGLARTGPRRLAAARVAGVLVGLLSAGSVN